MTDKAKEAIERLNNHVKDLPFADEGCCDCEKCGQDIEKCLFCEKE